MPTSADDAAPYSTLSLIRSRIEGLPSAEARVAQAILDQPFSALSMSAQELGEQAGCSAATAVRACHRLGYDGLPQLRIALARELGWTRLAVDEPVDGPETLLKTVMTRTSSVLAGLADHIDQHAFGAAVDAIANAARLLFVCSGPTQVVCADALFDLNAIGRPAEFVEDAVMQKLVASKLARGDVCIAVGVSGQNDLTIAAATAAHDAGATVIVMTSFAQSALSELGDIRLTVTSPDLPPDMHASITLVAMLLTMRTLTMATAQARGGVARVQDLGGLGLGLGRGRRRRGSADPRR